MTNGVRQSKADQAEAKKNAISLLKEWLPQGTTVYPVVKHWSRSGSSRTIAVLMVRDGEIRDISPWVARATQSRFDAERGGVRGAFTPAEIIHDLARVLFGRERGNDLAYTIL